MRLYPDTPQGDNAVAWDALYQSAVARLRAALSRLDASATDDYATDPATAALLFEVARTDLARTADAFCRIDAAHLYAADAGYTYGPGAVSGLPHE